MLLSEVAAMICVFVNMFLWLLVVVTTGVIIVNDECIYGWFTLQGKNPRYAANNPSDGESTLDCHMLLKIITPATAIS